MIIQVQKLIALKQFVGSFSYDYQPPQDKLILPLAEVEGSVHVEGGYEIFEDDSVSVSFRLSYKLKGQCSYCLEDASAEVEYPYDALFVRSKDDEDNYYYGGNSLNISPAVDEAFVFSQPQVLLCAKCAVQED